MSGEVPIYSSHDEPETSYNLEGRLRFLLGNNYDPNADITNMIALADSFQAEIDGYKNNRPADLDE